MPTDEPAHDLNVQLRALQMCLTADKRPLGLLLGAGCPLGVRDDSGSPLLPDIKGLTEKICSDLDGHEDFRKVTKAIESACLEDEISDPTIEDFLNLLRNVQAVGGKGLVRGIDPVQAVSADKAICGAIKTAVDKPLPSSNSPFHKVARWIRGIQRVEPVELFTPNYDLLLEQSLEESGVSYFDGFSGTRRAFLDFEAMENTLLPARWARLWKLHGSINWHRDDAGNVWRGLNSGDDDLLIYPSNHKYSQSRKMPFLAMQDRLKEFLSHPEATLIVCGYSFVDEHINALLRDGLRGNSRLALFGLVYSDLHDEHLAIPLAEEATNFMLMGRKSAVIGGRRRAWAPINDGSDSAECGLGDFAELANFISSVSGEGLDFKSS